MVRKVIVAGFVGWVVLAVWTFIVNGLLGFRSRIDMNQIANERLVYQTLRDNIIEPGKYACNPELTESRFPENEPVYSIMYSGLGHEAAGRESLVQMVNGLVMVMIATWMLATAGEPSRRSYARRVLFFTVIGLFVAASSHITEYGIGGYPLGDSVALAANEIVQWTVVGLFVAWRLKPES